MLQAILPTLMNLIEGKINSIAVLAWIVLVVSFLILAKSADLFVDSAVSVANKFNISKLIIGLILVSFATTAPELCVSLTAALKGNPEMALGNAVGSVICNTGLALGAAGILAPTAIRVLPKILKTSGFFLLLASILCFLFLVKDYTLSSMEGGILLIIFILYLAYMFREYKSGRIEMNPDDAKPSEQLKNLSLPKMCIIFTIGLLGILIASEFIVLSATSIAHTLHIPEAVIALTLVALGTSIPEVATCIIAARKGHGEIAIGNILGANILNICWVAGASAMANKLILSQREMFFMFPAMFIITITMLIALWTRSTLTKKEGALLLFLYFIYITFTMFFFPPEI
jgi:cation:H+ antiporter